MDAPADTQPSDAAIDTMMDAAMDVPADTGFDAALPPCDDDWMVPRVAREGEPLIARFVHATQGLTHVEMRVSGGGSSVLEDVESGSAPFRWRFRIMGHRAPSIRIEFVADPDESVYGVCELGVEPASEDGGVPDTGMPDTGMDTGGECVPDCSDKLCGEDDGCGTPCTGSHRRDHGAPTDCRLPGNCGCGVEPNDNMECTGDGMCRIRCSCDCLPPQLRSAEAVAGLNHAASCTMVFRESGDPTIWDAERGVALCPVGYDPSSAAHCTECPPCHRSRDACGLASWCECVDPGYRARDPQYNAMCGG